MSLPDSPTPRRIVLCVGQHCTANGNTKALFEQLKQVLGYPDPFDNSRPIKWTIASCLSHCDYGPNLVIYPEGDWYEGLTESTLSFLIEDTIKPLLKS